MSVKFNLALHSECFDLIEKVLRKLSGQGVLVFMEMDGDLEMEIDSFGQA